MSSKRKDKKEKILYPKEDNDDSNDINYVKSKDKKELNLKRTKKKCDKKKME